MVCLYVNDMIYMGSSDLLINNFKSCMMSNFEMSDLGLLKYFLGREVLQNADGMFVCQKKYASDLLKRFGMKNCEVTVTPMNINVKLRRDVETENANARLFRKSCSWVKLSYTH